VLPFWSGERSTGWHDEARGAILGLSLHTRPIEIARAAMEAICYRFAAIADALRAVAPIEEWIASGGALQRSVFWTQMLADILEQPVGLSGVREASSRGAALLALEAMGRLRLCDVRPTIVRRFEPEAERASRYRAARARHERLYRLILEAGDP
jgi:gluconokinase